MAYKELTTTYKINAFKRARRQGDIATIAEATGFSPAMVSMTLSGQRNNETIVNKAYRLVRRRAELA
jgi:predicted transcriptional regulator